MEDNPRRKESWILKLKKDELIDKIAQRGLNVDGRLPVLRERLIRFERVEAERVVLKIIDSGIDNATSRDATGNVTEPRGSQTTASGDVEPRAPVFPTRSSIACQTYRVAGSFRHPPAPDRTMIPDLAYHGVRVRAQDRRREVIHTLEEQAKVKSYLSSERADPRVQYDNSKYLPQDSPINQKQGTDPVDRFPRKKRPSNRPVGRSNDQPGDEPGDRQTSNPFRPREAPAQVSQPGIRAFKCWNCDQEGHRHSDIT